ncbi:MAG: hypothetical protein WBG92_16975 [Thiohalocapsa sp.]
MNAKHAIVTTTAALGLTLSGLVLADQAAIEAAEAKAEAAAEAAEIVGAAAADAQAEADAAVSVADDNPKSIMAQEVAEGTSLDAAALKEAEAVTSEMAKETKTDAMLKEQDALLQSAE